MTLIWWAYVASAVTTIGSVCFFAFLRSLAHDVCAGDVSQQSSSNSQGHAIAASLAWAAAAAVANAGFLSFRSRDKQGLALLAALCAKWKTAYFLMVSIERIVVTAVMVAARVNDHSAVSCALTYQLGQILATELLMAVALLLFSLSAICCDYDPDFTPAMRRGAYSATAVCFVLDMIFSLIWGSFRTKTDQGYLFIGPFTFILLDQITSCVASQLLVLLHLLYVSCRCRGGRGWVFASLRFELVKKHNIGTLLDETTSGSRMMSQMSSSSGALQHTESVQGPVQARLHVFSQLRHRLLQFRMQRMQTCQVFAIPCEECASNLSEMPVASGLEVARPLFRIKLFPDIIVRSAELYGNFYVCVVSIITLVSLVCTQIERTGTATLVLNCFAFYGLLGFFSCRRHNIDSVAAKHVATSFRFVCICMVLLFYVALEVRKACLAQQSPEFVVAVIIINMGFLLCLVADCSPNLPTIAQTAISVRS